MNPKHRIFRQRWLRLALMGLWFGLGMCSLRPAYADDIRLALLIGHETGWSPEPKLKYAIAGDLIPMAAELRALGFTIKMLKNPTPAAVRRIFQWVQKRAKQSPKISTFFFYYTGHADKHYFHLGAKAPNPLGYQEFSRFFQGLPTARRVAVFDSCYSGEIIREFGSLRQYQALLQQGQLKGIRRARAFDLSRLSFPPQGNEKGVRIISSSLGVAWELHRYRASVFTYHFLRGLRGQADLDGDGKITLDELFDFSSRAVMRETGQKPEQLILTRRSRSYALAPAYRSRLWIEPDLTGHITITVANFLWSHHKQHKTPIRLAVVPGLATIGLQRQTTCWQQQLQIPAERELRLSKNWSQVPCASTDGRRKGRVALEGRLLSSTDDDMAPRSAWQFAVFGTSFVSQLAKTPVLFGAGVGMTHRWFDLQLAFGMTSISFQQGNAYQMAIELRPAFGYRFEFPYVSLFGGGFVGLGCLLQDINWTPRIGGMFRYGLTLSTTFGSGHWHAVIGADVGFAVLQKAQEWQHPFLVALRLGIVYRL